jgi:hypothetical protein
MFVVVEWWSFFLALSHLLNSICVWKSWKHLFVYVAVWSLIKLNYLTLLHQTVAKSMFLWFVEWQISHVHCILYAFNMPLCTSFLHSKGFYQLSTFGLLVIILKVISTVLNTLKLFLFFFWLNESSLLIHAIVGFRNWQLVLDLIWYHIGHSQKVSRLVCFMVPTSTVKHI